MRYQTLEPLPSDAFKRLTGVRPEIFTAMLEVLTEKIRVFGRPTKLSLADRLLLTLLYWREYRTLFHLSQDFGVSEATACRTVHKIEKVLIQSEHFHLPGKKALTRSETVMEVILVDATECPVERPKKDSESTLAGRRSVTLRKSS